MSQQAITETVTKAQITQLLNEMSLEHEFIKEGFAVIRLTAGINLLLRLQSKASEPEGEASSISLSCVWKGLDGLSLKVLNTFNRTYPFTKAYFTEQGSLCLEMDFLVSYSSLVCVGENIKLFMGTVMLFKHTMEQALTESRKEGGLHGEPTA